jgi:hypothetical protein
MRLWREIRFPAAVAIQIPMKTITIPTMRFQLSGSCSRAAPISEAVIGLTVTEIATRVGVVRSSAKARRKNVSALPKAPR